MTNTINLSERLKTVASFLPIGTFFVDIGSDHAYLPCYVCLKDPHAQAIAGEVNQGPYKSGCETVISHKLMNQIEVRLGDGLEVLANDQVNQLTIAGMGGSLITNILDRGKDHLGSVERIIAQPNIGERNVRHWFLQNGFMITHEVIIEENDHIYEVLVADRGLEDHSYVDDIKEKQLLFGPILLQEKTAVFKKKWQLQQQKLQQVIDQMKQAKVQNNDKVHQLEKELSWIKEVVDHGENDN